MIKKAFFFVLFYASIFNVHSETILYLKGEDQVPVIAPYLSYRITNSADTTWRLFDVEEASIPPMSKFEANFSFRCANKNSVVFEWPDNKIEFLDVEVLNSKGDTCAFLRYNDEKGYSSPFFIKNQILAFDHPDTSETYHVHYIVRSHNPAYIVCWARTMQPFIVRFIKEYTWYGLFAGIVLCVFVLNILFYFSQKDSTFLWYALYTISLAVFHWAYTGVGFQWIWPEFTTWNRYSYMIASFLMLSFQYVYLYKYTKKLNPIQLQYIVWVVVFRFVILAVTLVHPAFSRWHLLLDFITLAFQLWIMWKIMLHKTLHGSLYIISITVLLFCYLIFIAAYYQFIPTTFFVYNAVAVGGIIELIVGMLALALRFKYLNDEKAKLQLGEIESLKSIAELKEKVLEESMEKERIQREVNKELEIKIKARTLELAQKNEKLEELNNKLLDMSSQLDKQNWSLNKELQGDRLKLMWGKDISFEEFKRTFPSDKHIFRFISDLKWQDGFQCKKCNGTEAVEGVQFMSKKCTQCKYEESVTANTLFHGVKFPLVQALYISLHTVIHRDSLPVKQLAEEIDLREATVWGFRKKTLERISNKNIAKGDVLRSLVSNSL